MWLSVVLPLSCIRCLAFRISRLLFCFRWTRNILHGIDFHAGSAAFSVPSILKVVKMISSTVSWWAYQPTTSTNTLHIWYIIRKKICLLQRINAKEILGNSKRQNPRQNRQKSEITMANTQYLEKVYWELDLLRDWILLLLDYLELYVFGDIEILYIDL